MARAGEVLMVTGKTGVGVPSPHRDYVDAVLLQGRGRRIRSGSSHILGLTLLPREKVADRSCRNEQRESRASVLCSQLLGRFEQLSFLRRLVSNEQVLRHR